MLRSFIALQTPDHVQDAIASSTAGLKEILPSPLIRWVPACNLHLTLKFLGDVSPVHLEQLADHLRTEVAHLPPFNMKVGSLGAFPSTKRARILWVGIEAPSALSVLQQSVENLSARMGYPSEDHPFSPHLTIGRVKQNATPEELARIRSALDTLHVGILGEVHVNSIHIYKSDLQPGGSVYTCLHSLSFLNSSEPLRGAI